MSCTCSYCKNNLEFVLPKEIIDATLSGNLVVFAGAGISTENRNVFRQTLYEEIKKELNLSKESLDFPTLMSKYCRQVNGRQRYFKK